VTSGVRIGTAALTTRGMDEDDMRRIGGWIADVLEAPDDESVRMQVRAGVKELTASRPLYR
jgi:glycine hydroxymethyltransferase